MRAPLLDDLEDIPFLGRAFLVRSPAVPVELRRRDSGYVLKGQHVLVLGTVVAGMAGPVVIAALKN